MHIRELRLVARDLDRQRDFYSRTLGLEMLEEVSGRFAVRAGETRLSFEEDRGAAGVYHFAFQIPDGSIRAAKRWLAERSPLLAKDGEDEFLSGLWGGGALQVYFRDADENILEVIAPPQPERAGFTGADLLRVVEVGWPVEDVPAATGRLCDALGVQPMGEPSPTFAPHGDRDGLFIVVPLGRSWFPTTDGAAALPLTVVVSGLDGTYREPRLPYVVEGSPEP